MEAEQAARAQEDARLRELYPLPEDEEDFQDEQPSDVNIDNTESETEANDIEESVEDLSSAEDKVISQEEGTR